MEENVAILMADLSGYTALTETHGAASAADLIDKYMTIAENCLVGDSRLCERAGDEIMIVSADPDDLYLTAGRLMQATSREDNFLQVHGGLHYGKLLKRRNSYFGAAINLTARIAANARPGTFWCSAAFRAALSHPSRLPLQERGIHRFKNVSEEQEIFELGNKTPAPVYIDTVCRMMILDTDKAIPHPHAADTYFCSSECLHIHLKGEHAAAAEKAMSNKIL